VAFVGGSPLVNRRRTAKQVPVDGGVATLSRDLPPAGLVVGSTICYAFMAVGMVNDHTLDCFRVRERG
jgi:DNA-3-methyladenine glycosylase I